VVRFQVASRRAAGLPGVSGRCQGRLDAPLQCMLSSPVASHADEVRAPVGSVRRRFGRGRGHWGAFPRLAVVMTLGQHLNGIGTVLFERVAFHQRQVAQGQLIFSPA